MNITKGRLKQIIQDTLKEEYTEREVTQDFTNPDKVRAMRRGWYDRGVLDGKNALESDTNQFGEQYSESYGGWNAKHGKPPVEYLDGYNDGSGGKAEEHYEEKVLQNRDDMLAQKGEMKEGTAKMNITKGRLKQIIQEELSRASVKEEVPVEEGLFDKVKQTVGLQGHEPEESPTLTVTAIDLVDAVSELIKRSLDSGADAGSLMGEVKKVFGENIPNPINDLFPIDMGE